MNPIATLISHAAAVAMLLTWLCVRGLATFTHLHVCTSGHFRPRALYRRWATTVFTAASTATSMTSSGYRPMPTGYSTGPLSLSTTAPEVTTFTARASSTHPNGSTKSDIVGWSSVQNYRLEQQQQEQRRQKKQLESWLFLAAVLLRAGHYGPALTHAARAVEELRRESPTGLMSNSDGVCMQSFARVIRTYAVVAFQYAFDMDAGPTRLMSYNACAHQRQHTHERHC